MRNGGPFVVSTRRTLSCADMLCYSGRAEARARELVAITKRVSQLVVRNKTWLRELLDPGDRMRRMVEDVEVVALGRNVSERGCLGQRRVLRR